MFRSVPALLLSLLCVALAFISCGQSGNDEADPSEAPSFVLISDPGSAPPWMIPYGGEFWRPTAAPREFSVPGDFDLGEIMERVSHAFRETDGGERVAAARSYRAAFSPDGLTFSPNAPPSEDGTGGATGSVAEARIRTRSVRAGSQERYAVQPEHSRVIAGNTAQTLLAPGLVEHFEARASGVEVSWVLQDRNELSGDLEIDLELEGLTFAGTTPEGFHYADADGQARVRVGMPEMVDALGTRTLVQAEAVGGSVRLTVPASDLARATFPIAIDPTISAEFGTDQPIYGPAAGQEYDAALASDGADYLARVQIFCGDRNGRKFGDLMKFV